MAFVATKFLLARLELELEGRAIGRQLSLTDGPNLEVSRGGGNCQSHQVCWWSVFFPGKTPALPMT